MRVLDDDEERLGACAPYKFEEQIHQHVGARLTTQALCGRSLSELQWQHGIEDRRECRVVDSVEHALQLTTQGFDAIIGIGIDQRSQDRAKREVGTGAFGEVALASNAPNT